MYTVNKTRPRFSRREWWTLRTKRQKRILQASIVGCIALGGIILSISISYDTEKPADSRPFDPDYMLGADGLVMNTHYNKRWRPDFQTEQPLKPTTPPPLTWDQLDSSLDWYHQRHRSPARPRTTTTARKSTTTTTSTERPTTTTTEATTTTTLPTTTTTITTTTTTTTTTTVPTTTRRSTTTSLFTTKAPSKIETSSASSHSPSWRSTVTTKISATTERNGGHLDLNYDHNTTFGSHSNAEPNSNVSTVSPSNSTPLVRTSSGLDNDGTADQENSKLNGISETHKNLNGFNKTEITHPQTTTDSNPNNFNRQATTETHFGQSTTPGTNFGSQSHRNNTPTTRPRVEVEDNRFSNITSNQPEVEKDSKNRTSSHPLTTTDVPQVFHLNASMSIESSIDSETIGSHHPHQSSKASTLSTTPPPSTIQDQNETMAFSFPQTPNVCLEDECFIVARKLNESIDRTIKPCENIYQHVCGNWHQMESPATDILGMSGAALNPDIKQDIKDLLMQPPLQYDSKAVKNVKTLYRACVRRVSDDRVSLVLLQKSLSKLTSFVRKSKSEMKGSDLGQLASHLITLHSNYLFPIGVVKDRKNVSRNVLHIGINEPVLQSKKNYESRLPYFNALRNLITDMANIMGVKSIVHKVLGFELLLAQITPERTVDYEEEYNPTTIGELESTTNVAWSRIFQSALDLTGENITIGQNETVIIQSKEYLKKLLDLLRDTDESDLIDYTVIRFVLPKLDAMPDQFYELYQRYKKIIFGIEGENRQLSCVIFAGNMMPGVVGKIYADRYFSEAVKYKNIHVPMMIHSTAIEMIRNLEWMDKVTKLEGLKKLYSMLQMIGNDETLSGDPFINQFQFMNDHMKNLFILDKYQTLTTFSQLRTINSRGKWASNSHPFEMKSFYSEIQNAIYIPAAMFQEPLFHDDLPLTMQFGALGSTVGHAYIHALDILGSKFDDNGNMKNWWTNKTRTDFQTRLSALNAYTLQDFSQQDIIESSADIGGIKISWRALKKMQREFNLQSMMLPGLNYTSDQLFFINYAQAWCNEKIMTNAMDRYGYLSKLPAKNRVIITLQNMQSFSDAFHCKVGDYMNPKEKTHIW